MAGKFRSLDALSCMVNVGGFNMFQRGLIVSLLEMMICKWYVRCMGVALDFFTPTRLHSVDGIIPYHFKMESKLVEAR